MLILTLSIKLLSCFFFSIEIFLSCVEFPYQLFQLSNLFNFAFLLFLFICKHRLQSIFKLSLSMIMFPQQKYVHLSFFSNFHLFCINQSFCLEERKVICGFLQSFSTFFTVSHFDYLIIFSRFKHENAKWRNFGVVSVFYSVI